MCPLNNKFASGLKDCSALKWRGKKKELEDVSVGAINLKKGASKPIPTEIKLNSLSCKRLKNSKRKIAVCLRSARL